MRRKWLTEDDLELMVIDDMEEARSVREFERWLSRSERRVEPRDDGYDPRDPRDRLQVEGGEL